tara:strand:+ start:103 stop:636 length:534 start_codon:yes stop_codon:yes gene_type:complete
MAVTALTTFIEAYTRGNETNDGVQFRFQNSEVGIINTDFNISGRSAEDYPFLSFLYQGAIKTTSGDALEASLILANEDSNREGVVATNKLSMSYAKEAVENNYGITVYTCQMNDAFTSVESLPLTVDRWIISSMSYDSTSIEILLTSGIDAVGKNTGRFLTTKLIGALPVTGQIFSR